MKAKQIALTGEEPFRVPALGALAGLARWLDAADQLQLVGWLHPQDEQAEAAAAHAPGPFGALLDQATWPTSCACCATRQKIRKLRG